MTAALQLLLPEDSSSVHCIAACASLHGTFSDAQDLTDYVEHEHPVVRSLGS